MDLTEELSPGRARAVLGTRKVAYQGESRSTSRRPGRA